MEFFKQTNIDFMSLRKYSATLSTVLFIISIAAFIHKGLNLGLDFTGGIQIEMAYPHAADLPAVRKQLGQAGLEDYSVTAYGSSSHVMITLPPPAAGKQQELSDRTLAALQKHSPDVQRLQVQFIGSQVGDELAHKGALALLVALLVSTIYIGLRFEYRLAFSAVVALIHDPILILGLFALFQWKFTLTGLAALLAVLGYSLNDTIVIFDRIRENFRKIRKGTPAEIINLSVNQTLSRTIMTSSLTMVVVIALLLYGGPSIRDFALALFIGIFIGTYSSIYVSGALSLALGLSKQDLLPKPKSELDALP